MNETNMTFEQNLTRLEQIVQSMESGKITLDESMELFQEGTALVRCCEKLLDEAELRVVKVLSGEDGSPREEAFEFDKNI